LWGQRLFLPYNLGAMTAIDKTAGNEFTTREMCIIAREIFQHALEESSIERGFSRSLHHERGILQIGDDLYDLGTFSRVFVIAFGKAAHSSLEALITRFGAGTGVTGIVSAPTLPASQFFGFRYFQGGHPMPNHESMRAAEAILRALDSMNARSLVLYLISGGGSAIVEKPVSDQISLDDLIQTYQALVHSGAPIAQINAVRKHLSAVKGGRMAVAAAPSHQVSILISDVPDNAMDSLASGPTMPDTTSCAECYDIVRQYNLLPLFPKSVSRLFQSHGLEETPKQGDSFFERARWWTVLSNVSAQRAAVECAALKGFAIQIDNTCDDWDYRKAADYLLQRVRELRLGVSRVCLISGGEVTVKVDRPPGAGGRNQQFALYCAQKIQGENISVLSAGTDGIDGNSLAAGAVVDGTTIARAQARGLSDEAALASFDAYPFFDALGDTIMTGYTGTNVRDVRVLLAW
jgi:hydroxypyruvate reductase